MAWIFGAVVPVVVIVVVLAVLYARIKAKAQSAVDELREQHGDAVRLVTGCGVVDPPNRVPGVLALLDDRLIYRSLIGLAGGEGEIPLGEMQEITWEDSWQSRHHMARKYRKSRVLGITTASGETKVFAIQRDKAADWEAALPAMQSSS